MVASRASWVHLARLQHCAHAVERPVELPVRHAEDGRASRIWVDEAEDGAQRGRLTGAVRAEKAGDRARLDPEAQPRDRLGLAEALAEVDDLDHASAVT